jgi:hypothetical protein
MVEDLTPPSSVSLINPNLIAQAALNRLRRFKTSRVLLRLPWLLSILRRLRLLGKKLGQFTMVLAFLHLMFVVMLLLVPQS